LEIRNEYINKKVIGHPRPDLYKYLSFIYRNREWKADFYDFFNDKTRRINKGKVRINYKDNIQ
ncbi:MAG: hypothetical protein R6U55_04290, partial [Desulfovermiculus sp.]